MVNLGATVIGGRLGQQIERRISEQQRQEELASRSIIFQRRGGSQTREKAIQDEQQGQAQREQMRLRELLDKSQKQLLSPKERIELEQLTTPKAITRAEGGLALVRSTLSPLERFRRVEQSKLEAQTKSLTDRERQLQTIASELQNRFEVLQRLADRGLLQSGVATKFQKDVEAYNSQIEQLNQQKLQQQAKITGFKTTTQKETKGLPKTVVEAAKSGLLPQNFKRELTEKEKIVPPMGLKDIQEKTIQTGKTFGEFGKTSFQRAGLPFLAKGGQAVFGGIGLAIGGVEATAQTAFDVALYKLEERQGRPAELRLRRGSIEEAGVKFFAGIPFVGEITGAKQAITPEGVKITRPVIREAATTALLLGAPEIAKLSSVGIKAVSKASRAEQFFSQQSKRAIIQEVSPKVIGEKIVPQRTTLLLGKILEKDVFLGLPKARQPSLLFQARSALKEFKGIVGRQPPKPITIFERQFKMQRGQVVLQEPMPFIVGEISKREAFFSKLKLGQSGQIGLGRTRTLQIETPRTRVRGLEFYDPYETLLEKARIVSPAFKRGFKIPAEAQLETVLQRGLGATQARQVSNILGVQLTGLKSFEQSLVLPKARLAQRTFSRMAEREAEAMRTLSKSAMWEASALKSMEKLLTVQRTIQRQRTERATVFKERQRLKEKQKLKPFLFPLPVLKPLPGAKDFFGTGFEVFVKRKGKFEKVSKEVLTEKSAKGLGQFITSQTSARTFLIKPVQGKAKRIEEYEQINLGAQFRRPFGKTRLPSQAFVEKSAYAINRPRELIEITRKGQAARRAKAKKMRRLF